jgi:hypothetical protein
MLGYKTYPNVIEGLNGGSSGFSYGDTTVVVSSGFGDEFVGIDFGDARLSHRIVRIADRLGKCCQSSIPAATDGRAEMEAVYRFMGNPKVSAEKLMGPHRQATLERIGQCDVVLLVQDTTELDVTRPSQQVRGAGPLTHNARRGSFYHPLFAGWKAFAPHWRWPTSVLKRSPS